MFPVGALGCGSPGFLVGGTDGAAASGRGGELPDPGEHDRE